MRTYRAHFAFALLLLACGDDDASTGGTGAGSNTAPSCIEDPWSCPAGQTCWISADQKSFACLNSGQGQPGAECQNLIGSPTCTDDLLCLQLQAGTPGQCTQYCDPADAAHACADGRQCLPVQLAGQQFHACEPPDATGGGGAGGGADGGGGAGGSGGSGGN